MAETDQEKVRISLSMDVSLEAFKQTHFYIGGGEFKNLSKVITQRVWSPIVWTGGVRKKDNFLSSSLLALDSDSGTWSLADAKDWVDSLGVAAIIGTTKSHQKVKGKEPACDRFRVLIPTIATCNNLDDFEYTMRMYIESMGCDISCKDGARFYYPCKEIFYQRDGLSVHWMECPMGETAESIEATRSEYYMGFWRDHTTLPDYVLLPLMHGSPVGSRHVETYKIACFFCRTGWSEDECFGWFESFVSKLLFDIGEKDVRRCIGNAYKRIGPVSQPPSEPTKEGKLIVFQKGNG